MSGAQFVELAPAHAQVASAATSDPDRHRAW
jgi:hypothetical protein